MNTFAPLGGESAGAWHDYEADDIWGDYNVAMNGQTPVISEAMAHTPGVGRFAPGGAGPRYDHGNLIGTNEVMTGGAGLPPVAGRRVFTAFGEPVYAEGESSRYGYAGQWGYQSASQETSNGQFADPLADLGWLHVGARYYDPAAGRFMQRDPIGIRGGMNTYAYVKNDPLRLIDPSGLKVWTVLDHIWSEIDDNGDYVEYAHYITYDDNNNGFGSTAIGAFSGICGIGAFAFPPAAPFLTGISLTSGALSTALAITSPKVINEFDDEIWRVPMFP